MSLANRVALNSSVQTVAQVGVAVLSLFSVAITARYLSPEDYGGLLAAVALVSIFSTLTEFGLPTTAARWMANRPQDAPQTSASILLVGGVMATVGLLAILAFSQLVYSGGDDDVTRTAVAVLAVPFLLDPLRCVAQARYIVEQRIWMVAVAVLAGRATSLGLVVLAAGLDLGPTAVAAAFAASSIVQCLIMIVGQHSALRCLERTTTRRSRALLGEASSLGGILIMNFVYLRVGIFTVSILGSKVEVAEYGVSARVFEMLIVVPSFVMITLIPELARQEEHGERLRLIVGKALNAMQVLSLGVVAASVLSPDILRAIAGPAYGDAGGTLTILLVALALTFATNVFATTLVALGRQGRVWPVSAIVLATNIALNLALFPLLGIRGSALALLISEALSLVLMARLFREVSEIPRPFAPARALLAAGCAGLAASIPSLVALTDQAGARLVLGGALGGLAYVAALVGLRALPPALAQILGPPLRRLRRA